jgi:hypothetical protein
VQAASGLRWQAGAGSKVTNATMWASVTANQGALKSLLYRSYHYRLKALFFAYLIFFRFSMSNVPTGRKIFADTEKKDRPKTGYKNKNEDPL